MTIPSWILQGACHDTDDAVFFLKKGGSTKTAKAICARCPVQAPCLDYAVTNGERYGIWGGKTERERRKLRRAS